MAVGAENGGNCIPDGGGIGDIRGVCSYGGDTVGVLRTPWAAGMGGGLTVRDLS